MQETGSHEQFISYVQGARQDPEPWTGGVDGPLTQPFEPLTEDRLVQLDEMILADTTPEPAEPEPEMPTRTQARLARKRRRRLFHLGCTICVLGWIALILYLVVKF